METQAHAQYAAIWGALTPGNTRDLPDGNLIEQCRVFLAERGHKVYRPKRLT
jgi:hypothetical protein